MAQRVLGLGDVVGLMKDFEQVVDQKKATDDAMKMLQGKFEQLQGQIKAALEGKSAPNAA